MPFIKKEVLLMNDDIIVGLDIGTANIRAVVAEKLENGNLQIIGIGTSSSTGMRKGAVTNIESTVQGILKAVESAEMMSGLDIEDCIIGLGGVHIEGLNSRGVYPVTNKGKNSNEISKEDIDAVIESAKAIVVPMDREIVHVIPQSYIVDGEKDIKDPINMIGVRLEAEVHIITGSVTSIKNIIMCVNRANLKVANLMHYSLADVKSVMTRDEQEMGSVLIDIGAGTTDIVVMKDGAPILTTALPVGGNQVTNDLALVKQIPPEIAEQIKCSDGCCWCPFIEDKDQILLPAVAGRGPEEISKVEICKIFQARMEELFVMVKDKVDSLNKDYPLYNSIVLCGGGALINGASELAEKVFGTPTVRIGIPSTIGGLTGEYRSPEYAAVLGLILRQYENMSKEDYAPSSKSHNSGVFFKKIEGFLKEFF